MYRVGFDSVKTPVGCTEDQQEIFERFLTVANGKNITI